MDNNKVQEYVEKERAKRYKRIRIIKRILLALAIIAGVVIGAFICVLVPTVIRHNNKIRLRNYYYTCEELASMIVSYEFDRIQVYKNSGEYLPELEEYKGNYIDYVESNPDLAEAVEYSLNTFTDRDRVEIEDIDDFYRNKFDNIHYEIEVTENEVIVTVINDRTGKEITSYKKERL